MKFERTKDGNGLIPINLASIEGGEADYRRISDMELCTELDALARNKYGRHSVYQMTLKEKEVEICLYLQNETSNHHQWP